jgi:hypothetical protein
LIESSWVAVRSKETNSLKLHYLRLKDKKVDMLIRDGLQAYDKAGKIFGKQCKNIVAGIKIKYRLVMCFERANKNIAHIDSRIYTSFIKLYEFIFQ